MNEIRKEELSIRNRCLSILKDSEFIEYVNKCINFPLVANKRGGDWYVPPSLKYGESYFKSTDGHQNQVNFNLKRLNLHIAEIANQFKGVCLVDTTRKGKKMPDSFSKTVPVWCAVLNKAILDVDLLVLHPQQVTEYEKSWIHSQVPVWAAKLLEIVPKPDLPNLSAPLRPMFIVNGDFVPTLNEIEGYLTVVLVTASKRTEGLDRSMGFTYIQGAADDHELWAPKQLTPEFYWLDKCKDLRNGLTTEVPEGADFATQPNKVDLSPFVSVVYAPECTETDCNFDLRKLGLGKKGARQLAVYLPKVKPQLESAVDNQQVVIACLPSSDLGLSLAILLTSLKLKTLPNKTELLRISAPLIAASGFAPSRATYNVVGSFLRQS